MICRLHIRAYIKKIDHYITVRKVIDMPFQTFSGMICTGDVTGVPWGRKVQEWRCYIFTSWLWECERRLSAKPRGGPHQDQGRDCDSHTVVVTKIVTSQNTEILKSTASSANHCHIRRQHDVQCLQTRDDITHDSSPFLTY